MTKIEEVARAIWDEDTQCDGLVTTSDWQEFKPIYMRVARAAIEAMREPTPEMLRPLWSCCAIDEADAIAGASEAWKLAIDAALKETP